MFACVLLPDHLHCIWSLPEGDDDFPARWASIKRFFTHHYLAGGGTELPVTESRDRQGGRGVWQPRYWEHRIRDEDDWFRLRDYIHLRPRQTRVCRASRRLAVVEFASTHSARVAGRVVAGVNADRNARHAGRVIGQGLRQAIACPTWLLSRTDDGPVLDPFCGAGSTLLAAKKLNKRSIGIDISEDYVRLSRERTARESSSDLGAWKPSPPTYRFRSQAYGTPLSWSAECSDHSPKHLP